MKQLVLLAGLSLVSTLSFAQVNIKDLGASLKNPSHLNVTQNKNDLTIVYGGADISRRPTLVPHFTTA